MKVKLKKLALLVEILGGIAIFAGLIFSVIFWTPFNVFGDLQYILCSLVLIFLIGQLPWIGMIIHTT